MAQWFRTPEEPKVKNSSSERCDISGLFKFPHVPRAMRVEQATRSRAGQGQDPQDPSRVLIYSSTHLYKSIKR
jgi:hypothetical protein